MNFERMNVSREVKRSEAKLSKRAYFMCMYDMERATAPPKSVPPPKNRNAPRISIHPPTHDHAGNKHGTCSGLNQQAYFKLALRGFLVVRFLAFGPSYVRDGSAVCSHTHTHTHTHTRSTTAPTNKT